MFAEQLQDELPYGQQPAIWDPANDRPRLPSQWDIIQAARQIEDAPQARPSFLQRFARKLAA